MKEKVPESKAWNAWQDLYGIGVENLEGTQKSMAIRFLSQLAHDLNRQYPNQLQFHISEAGNLEFRRLDKTLWNYGDGITPSDAFDMIAIFIVQTLQVKDFTVPSRNSYFNSHASKEVIDSVLRSCRGQVMSAVLEGPVEFRTVAGTQDGKYPEKFWGFIPIPGRQRTNRIIESALQSKIDFAHAIDCRIREVQQLWTEIVHELAKPESTLAKAINARLS